MHEWGIRRSLVSWLTHFLNYFSPSSTSMHSSSSTHTHIPSFFSFISSMLLFVVDASINTLLHTIIFIIQDQKCLMLDYMKFFLSLTFKNIKFSIRKNNDHFKFFILTNFHLKSRSVRYNIINILEKNYFFTQRIQMWRKLK